MVDDGADDMGGGWQRMSSHGDRPYYFNTVRGSMLGMGATMANAIVRSISSPHRHHERSVSTRPSNVDGSVHGCIPATQPMYVSQ